VTAAPEALEVIG
jgi:hypothetical protein